MEGMMVVERPLNENNIYIEKPSNKDNSKIIVVTKGQPKISLEQCALNTKNITSNKQKRII